MYVCVCVFMLVFIFILLIVHHFLTSRVCWFAWASDPEENISKWLDCLGAIEVNIEQKKKVFFNQIRIWVLGSHQLILILFIIFLKYQFCVIALSDIISSLA